MERITIGKVGRGLQKNFTPFNIDNDAFPVMRNAYPWRGRVKRKRGTVPLARLQVMAQTATSPQRWQYIFLATVDGSGNASANIITKYSLGSSASITPGSLNFSDGVHTWVEPTTPNGTLVIGATPSGTINYSTGAITFTGGTATNKINGTFSYFPGLPSMGIRDLVTVNYQYPLTLAFDTVYSYQVANGGSNFFSTNYYKATKDAVYWTGGTYQQFWTTNYQGALWATNGKPGFQFEPINTIGLGAITTITTVQPHGLISGNYVWFNEVPGDATNLLNGQTLITTNVNPTTFTVAVNTGASAITNGGIFQTLTTTAQPAQGDGIKWYDGDPTGGTGLPTGNGLGWVNFAPPLTGSTVALDNQTPALYYLVGATAIVPFKDRILFFAPWIQASTGAARQLKDTVIWSWNGTPYYTTTGTSSPYVPIQCPVNETADPTAYWVDQTGKGGFLSAGITQAITTVNINEDVLIVGFTNTQTRLVYTGNDLQPFLFYSINAEFGSSATFSGITLDRGSITFGTYGILLTTQESCARIDLEIPDTIFDVQQKGNGAQRICSVRDYANEWIYFAFSPEGSSWSYPTNVLQFNYRENNWAIHYENYTSMGVYRKQSTGKTWAQLNTFTWAQWNEPWNSSTNSQLFPAVVAGNPQGFVVQKSDGTGEAPSGHIAAIANTLNFSQITSIDHCVSVGDYLYVNGCLGTTDINLNIGKVITVVDANNFVVDIAFPSGTYLGLGVFTRLSQPLIQTKQFPVYWDQGRKVRLGVQQYLMETTQDSQSTINIYLSQDANTVWNSGSIVPTEDPNPINNSLLYSQVLFTSPEANNLQMPTAVTQAQIWHRVNTSLIGDTFQVGITLSDTQMRDIKFSQAELVCHGMIFNVEKGPVLA